MKKKIIKMLGAALLAVIVAFSSSCSQQRDYGEEYNYETDCQHSYYGSVTSWNKIQSDGEGQYVLKNNYIYYYNTEKKTMTPLCNKSNCLHDMETDESRLDDCNAYAPSYDDIGDERIQYYDGYIYYVDIDWEEGCSLYRVKKDGSKKDKIFTTDDQMPIYEWLIHRGRFYYSLEIYYNEEDNSDQVYKKCILKSLELSSNMKEKKAKVIFESDEEHSAVELNQLKAYKNYLCYTFTADTNGVEYNGFESWVRQIYAPVYLYNIDTEENREIPVPKGYSETTIIGSVTFMEDKMLIKLYDNVQDVTGDTQNGAYKVPVYSMNYDLTDQKIWLDSIEQGKLVQTYGDYVIISDAMFQYLSHIYQQMASPSDLNLIDVLEFKTNVEIYSSDAKRISYFVYPMNVAGNFNGFGPDGVNVEVDEDDDSWSVYELRFEDVLNCKGEEVELEKVSTRKFGLLNKED